MSTSLLEIARDAENRARACRLVAARYPAATPEVLWDDGPTVPCLQGDEALALATGLDLRTRDKLHILIPYFTICDGLEDPGDKESRPFKVRVYVVKSTWSCAYANSVLGKLSPEMTAALLDAVRRA